MKRYIGLKVIDAEPQGRMQMDDNDVPIAGSQVPGYRVVYPDDYESWSPKDVFDSAYRELGSGLPFSIVLESMKRDGTRWEREGWNGSNMWVTMQRPDENSKMDLPYFFMNTVTGDYVPWVPSVTDLIADDWFEVGE